MSAASIEEVLDQLGIQTSSSGVEISAHCPFHTDSHPSFSINAESGLWICYQCSRAGTLSMLVEAVGGEGANPVEILREVRHKSVGKTKAPDPEPAEQPPDPDIVLARYEGFRFPPEWAWSDRKIGREAVEAYGLKWDKGWVIPIWSPSGEELWGWQFKRMDFVSNYPKAVKKSLTLFGLRELTETTVVLVESPLDVVRLATVGVSAVAAYGAFVSRAQIRLLIEVSDRIILALDSDEEGQKQTDKIYPYLARQIPTIKVTMPAGAKDPGDLSDKKALRVFEGV